MLDNAIMVSFMIAHDSQYNLNLSSPPSSMLYGALIHDKLEKAYSSSLNDSNCYTERFDA